MPERGARRARHGPAGLPSLGLCRFYDSPPLLRPGRYDAVPRCGGSLHVRYRSGWRCKRSLTFLRNPAARFFVNWGVSAEYFSKGLPLGSVCMLCRRLGDSGVGLRPGFLLKATACALCAAGRNPMGFEANNAACLRLSVDAAARASLIRAAPRLETACDGAMEPGSPFVFGPASLALLASGLPCWMRALVSFTQ
jgi:hypothetical protein